MAPITGGGAEVAVAVPNFGRLPNDTQLIIIDFLDLRERIQPALPDPFANLCFVFGAVLLAVAANDNKLAHLLL